METMFEITEEVLFFLISFKHLNPELMNLIQFRSSVRSPEHFCEAGGGEKEEVSWGGDGDKRQGGPAAGPVMESSAQLFASEWAMTSGDAPLVSTGKTSRFII